MISQGHERSAKLDDSWASWIERRREREIEPGGINRLAKYQTVKSSDTNDNGNGDKDNIKINEVPIKRKRLNEHNKNANKVFPLQQCEFSGFSRPANQTVIATIITNNTMAAPTACTRFSDNYDIKEELGK